MYGFGQQGHLGDNQEKTQPSYFHPLDRMKWNSWEEVKGMSQVEARQKLLDIALPVLIEQNIDSTDPEKANIEKVYEECQMKNQALVL